MSNNGITGAVIFIPEKFPFGQLFIVLQIVLQVQSGAKSSYCGNRLKHYPLVNRYVKFSPSAYVYVIDHCNPNAKNSNVIGRLWSQATLTETLR